MNKPICWRAYRKYLHEKGKSDFSNAGNPSTTFDYPSRVDRICKREGFNNWDDFCGELTGIIEKYKPGGSESEYGNQSNGSNLKALELFLDFYLNFDSEVDK